MSIYDYLNDDQRGEMERLSEIPPELRCYCGWYELGQCPHCPAGKTCAEKLHRAETPIRRKTETAV